MVSMRGVANGVASLDSGGLVPTAQLPSTFLTGMGMDWWLSTLPTGWVWADGRTIGNASSGATARANADCYALFVGLWAASTNTELAVSGGRGASADADWTANKTIALPDKRGRVSAGKDDMGGTAASRLTAANGLDGTKLAGAGGSQTHTLTSAQIPSHTHTGSTATGGSHSHTIPLNFSGNTGGANTALTGAGTNSTAGLSTDTHAGHTHTVTINANTGGDGAHNNTQPTIVCNYIIKL